jgi:hypothetical protein
MQTVMETELTKRERILDAARAYAEREAMKGEVHVREFGMPSLDHNDLETHFVVVESAASQLLLKITLDPEGRAHAEPLTV